VGLAHAWLPFEQQAFRYDGKGVGNATRLRDGLLKRLVVRCEVAERAVQVSFGDVRVSESLAADVLAPAIASHHPASGAAG
jgi:hypothetical protein